MTPVGRRDDALPFHNAGLRASSVALLLAALLFGALALAGCADRPALDGLEGTAWTLSQYRDADGALVVEAYGTLAFRADLLDASSCNACGLAYVAEEGLLRFGPAGCTERLCAAGQAFELGDELDRIDRARYVIEGGGDVLRLDFEARAVMVFRRLDPLMRTEP